MATIETAIKLNDMMTSQLKASAEQAEKLVGYMEKLDSALESLSARNTEQVAQAMDKVSGKASEAADEQETLNRKLTEGKDKADALLGKIKGIVTAYVSMKSVEAIISASDELSSNTARLQMMVQNFAGDTTAADQISAQTDALQNKVFASANASRASVSDLMDVVARFGNNARDAFSSTDEVVRFSELVQKQMTISGASTEEASNAILQLSQALGSGVLRGDELNSIFEQAPSLIRNIADYMGVSVGEIRSLASEGTLSADIVKNAVMSAGDEIDAQFEQMPYTFGQAMTLIQNRALQAFQPVLNKIGSVLNSSQGQAALQGVFDALAGAAYVAMDAINAFGNAVNWVQQNLSWIEPIVWTLVGAFTAYAGVMAIGEALTLAQAAAEGIKGMADLLLSTQTFAATAAQQGFNAALLACPITWIVIAIMAAVAALIYFGTQAAVSAGMANSAFGTVTGAINVVGQFFKNLGLSVANIFLGITSATMALASNMMAAFHNAISNVQSWFYSLLSTACSVIAGIAEALNQLPFVSFDYSGITNAASEYASKASEAAGNKESYQDVGAAFKKGSSTYETFQSGWASDAFKSGAEWGDGVSSKISSKFKSATQTNDWGSLGDYSAATAANTADTAGSAGSIKDSLDDTEDDIAYLCDIAERDAINRFTTAAITVDMTNNNTVNSSLDLDGIMNDLAVGLNNAMAQVAEGSHY